MSQKKITKSDLVASVYLDVQAEKKVVQEVVDSLMTHIKDALRNNSVIELRGFGTFEVRARKGRLKARNPKTGESLSVEPHGVVFFRPGRELKKDVWNLINNDNESTK